MAQLTTEPRPQQAGRQGRWFLALGIVLIALGAVGLGGTVLPELLTTLVLGPLLLAGGVGQIFLAFVADPKYQKPATIAAGSLSGFKSVGNPAPDDPNITKILGWIDKHGTIAAGINLAQFSQIRLLRIPLMQSALLGKTSVQDTLTEMDKQIDAVLAQP